MPRRRRKKRKVSRFGSFVPEFEVLIRDNITKHKFYKLVENDIERIKKKIEEFCNLFEGKSNERDKRAEKD